jgi:hypothetical protein
MVLWDEERRPTATQRLQSVSYRALWSASNETQGLAWGTFAATASVGTVQPWAEGLRDFGGLFALLQRAMHAREKRGRRVFLCLRIRLDASQKSPKVPKSLSLCLNECLNLPHGGDFLGTSEGLPPGRRQGSMTGKYRKT